MDKTAAQPSPAQLEFTTPCEAPLAGINIDMMQFEQHVSALNRLEMTLRQHKGVCSTEGCEIEESFQIERIRLLDAAAAALKLAHAKVVAGAQAERAAPVRNGPHAKPTVN